MDFWETPKFLKTCKCIHILLMTSADVRLFLVISPLSMNIHAFAEVKSMCFSMRSAYTSTGGDTRYTVCLLHFL